MRTTSLLHTNIKQFWKNLLLWNYWSYFEIIPQDSSLDDFFQSPFPKFWVVNKCGSGKWRLLALYGHSEIVWNFSSLKSSKMAMVHSEFQASNPGSSWSSWFLILPVIIIINNNVLMVIIYSNIVIVVNDIYITGRYHCLPQVRV